VLCYVAAETCDAVENDTYLINGIYVSNFVLPWWFATNPITNPVTGKPSATDFLGLLKGQTLTLRAGGYLQYDVPGQGWQEVFDRFVPAAKRSPGDYSRRARRIESARRLTASLKTEH